MSPPARPAMAPGARTGDRGLGERAGAGGRGRRAVAGRPPEQRGRSALARRAASGSRAYVTRLCRARGARRPQALPRSREAVDDVPRAPHRPRRRSTRLRRRVAARRSPRPLARGDKAAIRRRRAPAKWSARRSPAVLSLDLGAEAPSRPAGAARHRRGRAGSARSRARVADGAVARRRRRRKAEGAAGRGGGAGAAALARGVDAPSRRARRVSACARWLACDCAKAAGRPVRTATAGRPRALGRVERARIGCAGAAAPASHGPGGRVVTAPAAQRSSTSAGARR